MQLHACVMFLTGGDIAQLHDNLHLLAMCTCSARGAVYDHREVVIGPFLLQTSGATYCIVQVASAATRQHRASD